LHVMRDGRRQAVQVKLAERPQRDRGPDGLEDLGRRPSRPRPSEPADVPLGLTVRELDRTVLGRSEIPDGVAGVVISRVDPTGSAFQASLRRGLVIMEINKRPVPNAAEYLKAVSAAHAGDFLALYVFDPSLGQRSLVTVAVE
jgi:serine protease Do